MNAKFTDIHGAADYIGPGAIEVPLYQTEILDLVRRRGPFGQRIKQVPATGHPSRYFEETAIPAPAATREIYLVDRPNSVQTTLWLGNMTINRGSPDYVASSVMNGIFGGGPDARLFANLRESKG